MEKMFKMVDGERVKMTMEEIAAREQEEAEWEEKAANDKKGQRNG